MVIEIGMEMQPHELELVEKLLHAAGIQYYVEPMPKVPYDSLIELEADCEGK